MLFRSAGPVFDGVGMMDFPISHVLQVRRGMETVNDDGDPLGNGDLQRRNSVAFIAEIMFGWTVMKDDAFVKYVKPSEAGDPGTEG